MLSWYGSMAPSQRETFWACFMGWALDAMDVQPYTQLHLPMWNLLLLGFPLGLFQSGIVSGMGACFTELFPAQIRVSAGGFSYSFGWGMGALVPAGVGLTSASLCLAASIGIWTACSYVSVFIVAIFLPETRNKELEIHV